MATEVSFDLSACYKAMRTEEMKAELLGHAESIRDRAISTAPKTRRPSYAPSIRTSWDLVRSGVGPDVYSVYVVASRHEMVIEFGWHDLAGGWHPGRFILTNALIWEGRK